MSERPTWLVAGLGNPGRKYSGTRHNAGFMVIDELRRRMPAAQPRHRFDAEILEISVALGRLILLKPMTYMNLSGNAVGPAVRWYKVPLQRLLIVYDDLDLPFGQLRLRPSGSSGGHNGLTSVIQRLGTERIPRLRIGIGRPAGSSSISYVLTRFGPDEARALQQIIQTAADAVVTWQSEGIEAAMNMYNRREPQRSEADTRRNTSEA